MARLGVRVINASKESGTIFGQKALDDVTINVIKKAGGVEVVVDRLGNLAFILTSVGFHQDFNTQYERCVKQVAAKR